MDFVLDLLQGLGIAAGVGIRPFLPVILVGALAAGDLGLDFDGTSFAFLEQAPFLAAMLVLMAVTTIAMRRADVDASPFAWALLVLGGLGWLVAGGRRREGEKYAGLRILR